MDCDILKGRLLSCKNGVGGLRSIYFVNYQDMGPSWYTTGAGSDEITSITDPGAGSIKPKAYHYQLHLGNNLNSAINSSPENGTTYFSQVLSLTLKVLTQQDNDEVKQLAYGHPHILVEDNMGNIWLVGAKNGADITSGSAETGDDMGDFNGYKLEFTAKEPLLPQKYSGALATEFDVVEGV